MNLKLMNLDQLIKKWEWLEPYFFYTLTVLFVIPILSYPFFLTVDGPAHLYNSNLIAEMLWNADSPVKQFFNFNDTLTPNWTGHFILSTLITFLPGFIAEKIVLLFYVVGLPLSTRFLFNSMGVKNGYVIYLIFPFTYSFLFYYGFFNFNIAVVLLLFGAGLWIKKCKDRTTGNFIILTLLSSLICMTHLFVFAIFLIIIFIVNLEDLILFFRNNRNGSIELVKTYFFQLSCLLIGITIMLLFLASDSPLTATKEYLSFRDLFISLKYIMPAKGINYDEYDSIVKPLLYVFAGLIFWIGAATIYSLISKRKFSITGRTWLFICSSALILIFLVPDRIGDAGFISSRLMLFFFIFLIIWLATQPVASWIKLAVFITANIINVSVIFHNYNAQSDSDEILGEIRTASRHIEDYSTVLPVKYSDNFMHAHISNYLGADKPIIILENYEASLNQFPLTWNYKSLPSLKFGDSSPDECFSWPTSSVGIENQIIDYICVINDKKIEINNTCFKHMQSILDVHYNLVVSTTENRIKLYKAKLPLTSPIGH